MDAALAEHDLPLLQRSAWVEVDLDVLTANAAALGDLVAPAALAPVVKADGYGHGLEMSARCAVAGGARWLCVADAAEAVRLRSDGYRGPVFVLYPVPRSMWDEMARAGVHVTVSGMAEARRMAGRAGPGLRVHVEIDTGMTRGGVCADEAVDVARTLAGGPGSVLAGAWTHLAAPEDPSCTADQMARFDRAVAGISAAGLDPGLIHAAASGGILATDTTRHGLVRPGLVFYGLDPDVGRPVPAALAPALSVRAHPVRIAEVPAATRVGYAGTWTAERTSVVATLPIGYADGWARSSAPGTFALVRGARAPLVGRISSDSLVVDITGIDGVGPDSTFTLLGRDASEVITADEVAGVRGSISWEVLQQLGGRLTRVYTSASVPVAVRRESSTKVVSATGPSSRPGLVGALPHSYDRPSPPE